MFLAVELIMRALNEKVTKEEEVKMALEVVYQQGAIHYAQAMNSSRPQPYYQLR